MPILASRFVPARRGLYQFEEVCIGSPVNRVFFTRLVIPPFGFAPVPQLSRDVRNNMSHGFSRSALDRVVLYCFPQHRKFDFNLFRVSEGDYTCKELVHTLCARLALTVFLSVFPIDAVVLRRSKITCPPSLNMVFLRAST